MSITTRRTLHGLNYSLSDTFENNITLTQYLKREDINRDMSIFIESRSILPDLLGFISFIVIYFTVYRKGLEFKYYYYYSFICIFVYFVAMLIRDILLIYKTRFIPALCMIYQMFSSKFIDKIIILAMSYFLLNNVLIGIIYLVVAFILNIFFPIDNKDFNDKVAYYVYSVYNNY